MSQYLKKFYMHSLGMVCLSLLVCQYWGHEFDSWSGHIIYFGDLDMTWFSLPWPQVGRLRAQVCTDCTGYSMVGLASEEKCE